MEEMHCPCCGQGVTGDLPAVALRDVQLPTVAHEIVSALIAAYPRGLPRKQLVDAVYGLDPNGGPDSAPNVISVTINRTRPLLVPFGWTISDGRQGREGLSRLVRVDA